MFFLFSDELLVDIGDQYFQMAIVHAAHFQRVVNHIICYLKPHTHTPILPLESVMELPILTLILELILIEYVHSSYPYQQLIHQIEDQQRCTSS